MGNLFPICSSNSKEYDVEKLELKNTEDYGKTIKDTESNDKASLSDYSSFSEFASSICEGKTSYSESAYDTRSEADSNNTSCSFPLRRLVLKKSQHTTGENNFDKKTILRNFSRLEDDLDPLHFMDDLYEEGYITRQQMNKYQSINTQCMRARKFLIDIVLQPNDITSTIFALLEKKKYSFILHQLIYENRPHSSRAGCNHQNCALKIMKAISNNFTNEPVDTGKVITPLLENFLLPPAYFEAIAFKETLKERNEMFMEYLQSGNKDTDMNMIIIVYLEALTTTGYDVMKLFNTHCCNGAIDGFQSKCKRIWIEYLQRQNRQGNTKTKIQIQKNIDVEHSLYHPTGNEKVIFKITSENLSEQESKNIVDALSMQKESINANLPASQRIEEIQQGCIQIILSVPENKDIDLAVKSIRCLLEWGDVFYKVKDQHLIIKLYSINIPEDTGNEEEILSKYRILWNFPFLIEEIDVLHFVAYFTEKKLLSEKDFETKFNIQSSSRKIRTSYFLNYILRADKNCLNAFYDVLKNSNYRFVFDMLVKDDLSFQVDESERPISCKRINVRQQTDNTSITSESSQNSRLDEQEKCSNFETSQWGEQVSTTKNGKKELIQLIPETTSDKEHSNNNEFKKLTLKSSVQTLKQISKTITSSIKVTPDVKKEEPAKNTGHCSIV